MDMETFEQISLGSDLMGDSINYLKENMNITVTMYEGKPIGIELPLTVELEVVETTRSQGILFPAVPNRRLWKPGQWYRYPVCQCGDVIQVDTRTGSI